MASFNIIVLLAALAYFGSQNALAKECSLQDLQVCMSLMDMNAMQNQQQPPTSEQMAKMCKSLTAAQKCLTALMENCGEQESAKQQLMMMGQAMEACKPAGACSAIALMKCSENVTKPENPEDMQANYCKSFAALEKCLEPFKKCENVDIQKHLQEMTSDMAETQKMCAGSVDENDCSQADLMACASEFQKVGDAPEKLCEVSVTINRCLKTALSKCKSEESKKRAQETIATFPELDEGCCKFVAEVKVCSVQVENIKKTFNATKTDCQKLQQTYMCINGVKSKCEKGAIKEGMDMALKDMGTKQQNCQKEGYKVDASAQTDPNSGVSFQSTVVLVVAALVLAMY